MRMLIYSRSLCKSAESSCAWLQRGDCFTANQSVISALPGWYSM
uniref:Uncharacterized protein n=1 Tax=Arundo donax TaxID=35708 RepID=A0A0A9FK46_ARUDO